MTTKRVRLLYVPLAATFDGGGGEPQAKVSGTVIDILNRCPLIRTPWDDPLRAAQGGLVYHTLNRANARLTTFEDDGAFAAFERILADAVTRYAMRLLAYCVMPNHFHLLV
jgi:Transposase IS200 like